ncbi:MAG: LysR family transcriptional regulator [Pandoraea sp.]|nr:LysR family transcriptional regulator [Pandoraea sp.]MDR3398858.1 LysR family transcriptional regulator [Pandoraea sp.]
MDLRQLRYFATIAETGSIAAASRVLHIAQPALSRQMSALESTMETDLFERRPRGVVLTRAGHELLVRAKDLLDEAHQIKERVQLAARGETGTLRIGVMLGYSYLPAMVQAMQALALEAPGASVVIETMLAKDQFDALHDGHLDVAFVAWRPPLDTSLKGIFVHRDPVMVAMHVDVAQKYPDLRHLHELHQEKFMLFPRDRAPLYHDMLVMAFGNAGIEVTNHVVTDVPTILGLVSANMGCGIVGATYLRNYPRNVELRQVQGLDISCDVELVYRADSKDPLLNRFVELTLEQLPARKPARLRSGTGGKRASSTP